MSKESLKTFVHKVGTFRSKKKDQKSRKTLSEIKFSESNSDLSNGTEDHFEDSENRNSSFSRQEIFKYF